MSCELLYDGTAAPLSTWGVKNLVRSRTSQGVDMLTMTMDGRAADAADLFAYNAEIVIVKDGAGWFVGNVLEDPRSASGSAEGVTYRVQGAGGRLTQLVYQQMWKYFISLGVVDSTTYSAKVFLSWQHGRVSAKAQIEAAVQEVIDAGGNLEIGTVSLPTAEDAGVDLKVPVEEMANITCDEAIRKMLRWVPDAVTWFDYTNIVDSNYVPRFRCKRRAALDAVTLTVPNAGQAVSIDLRPRRDLIIPQVVLRYHRPGTQTGTGALPAPVIDILTDKWPGDATGRVFGALVMSIDLPQGTPTPPAVAKTLWSSLQELHWEGTVTVQTDDLPGTWNPGQVLNISGGKAEWTSMNALIQGVDEDLMAGTTTIRIGPPATLSPQDLVTLLQRRLVGLGDAPGSQDSGKGDTGEDGTDCKGVKIDKVGDDTVGPSVTVFRCDGERTVIASNFITIGTLDAGYGGTDVQVLISPNIAVDGAGTVLAGSPGASLKFGFTEEQFCIAGVIKKRLVLESEAY